MVLSETEKEFVRLRGGGMVEHARRRSGRKSEKKTRVVEASEGAVEWSRAQVNGRRRRVSANKRRADEVVEIMYCRYRE